MTGSDILIGVDGGGTGCRARLRNRSGELLGEGAGGPGNVRLGLDLVWTNILRAVDGALEQAGLDRSVLPEASIGLGLAGIVDDASGAAVLGAGPRFGAARAVSDAYTACLGAFSGRDGAILICGTGSAGFAVVAGTGIPIFGWGFEIDDRGSAAALGRLAIQAAIDAHDGLGPATDFTRAIFAATGGSPAALIKWTSKAQPRDYGGLAPHAMIFAERGDPVALALLREVVTDVEARLRRLTETGAQRVCLLGGMAKHLERWLSPWARSVLVEREQDALDGAILLARCSLEEVD